MSQFLMGPITDMQRMITRRSIEVTPEIEPVIEELFVRFCEKFGREPGPNDPIFFDPDADSLVPLPPEKANKLWSQVVDAWLSRGQITRETAYAMMKTGLAVTEENRRLLSKAELYEWNEACEEWRAQDRQRSTPDGT
jgi:hypothetical protein